MASYFLQLHHLIIKIIDESTNILQIHIYNTESVSKYFKNIEITIDGNTSRDLYVPFRFDGCQTWREMANLILMTACDIQKVLWSNNIDLPIHIKIRNYEHEYAPNECIEHSIFGLKLYQEMEKMDCIELMENYNFLEFQNAELSKIKHEVSFIYSRIEKVEHQIKRQSKAYLISKLISCKGKREDYIKKYPELIEAYDALIDIKKVLNNKPYTI